MLWGGVAVVPGMRERRRGRKAPRACRSAETPVVVSIPTGILALWGHRCWGTVTPSVCQSRCQLPAQSVGVGEQNWAGQEEPVCGINKGAGLAPGSVTAPGTGMAPGSSIARQLPALWR